MYVKPKLREPMLEVYSVGSSSQEAGTIPQTPRVTFLSSHAWEGANWNVSYLQFLLASARVIGSFRSLLKKFRIIATYYCVVQIMTNSAMAGNLEKLVPVRQSFAETEAKSTMDPLVIEKSEDGGYIVAGSMGKSGWASKTDAQGKTLWHYTTDLREKPAVPSMLPEYRGIAAMPDGRAWLCGNMPAARGAYSKGLLTHLHVNGQLLEERFLAPPEAGHVNLDGCIRWGNDFAIVGHITRYDKKVPPPGELPKPPSYWYWVIVMDSTGKLKWQKEISARDLDLVGGSQGTVLLTVESNLVFSMTNNITSEIVSINPKGEVQAQKKLDGHFLLVRPVRPDGLLQAVGTKPPHFAKVITFDNQLAEIRAVQGEHPSYFETKLVYRLPDQSYVFFGTGGEYRSALTHVDQTLAKEQAFVFGGDGLSDIGIIRAATPAYQPDEFITARSFWDKDINAPGWRRGLALDFIKLK